MSPSPPARSQTCFVMDLKSIKHFVHVADVGSITVAANTLNIVQPALSRQIKRIEDEAGAQLFERLPRGVQLTAAGLIYLEHCRKILHEMALANEALAINKESPGGRVTFGVPGTFTQILVPRLVASLSARFPNIMLRLIEGTSGALHEGLLEGRIQAAILNNPTPHGMTQLTPLISELLVVFASRQAGLRRRSYTLNELARTPVIVTAGFRGMVNEQIETRGKSLRVQYEIDSVEAIRRILLRGMGITILPASTLRDDVEEGLISAFPVEDISMHRMLAIGHLRHDLTPNVQAVIAAAQAEMADLAAQGVFSTIPRMRPGARPRLKSARSPD